MSVRVPLQPSCSHGEGQPGICRSLTQPMKHCSPCSFPRLPPKLEEKQLTSVGENFEHGWLSQERGNYANNVRTFHKRKGLVQPQEDFWMPFIISLILWTQFKRASSYAIDVLDFFFLSRSSPCSC